jgi:hypothetical protein
VLSLSLISFQTTLVVNSFSVTSRAFTRFSVADRSIHTARDLSSSDDNNNGSNNDNNNRWKNAFRQMAVTTFFTATVWTSGIGSFLDMNQQHQSFFVPPSAIAKEMASGSGSRVNKDPESLLRLGLPITNKEVCVYVYVCRFIYMFLLLDKVLFLLVVVTRRMRFMTSKLRQPRFRLFVTQHETTQDVFFVYDTVVLKQKQFFCSVHMPQIVELDALLFCMFRC